jgi:hypothetical protein
MVVALGSMMYFLTLETKQKKISQEKIIDKKFGETTIFLIGAK